LLPQKQWRINNARHLEGALLKFQRYVRWNDNWDHDHCAACWAKFAEGDDADILHEGYATCDDYVHGARYDWVCRVCFDELKEDLRWTEAEPDNPEETVSPGN
jgi:hypothetical protein